jgi:GT2 family glycosyltransferase
MTGETAPRILVMLPVHNRRATTELFLRCLLAQSYANWHLLLIDDGSTDGTSDMVRTLVPTLTILRGAGSWWWGGALHQGYRWLKGHPEHADDLVLIINDDTEFGPEFLEEAVRATRPGALLLAQLYKLDGEFEEAGVVWDWAAFDWKAVKTGEGINCFSTRGLFLYARDFRKIGGFYPRLLPHYLSDYEFTMRAWRKGFALITAPSVHLRYNEALSGIRSPDQPTLLEYLRKGLSIKSANNPIYWTSFILLASPLRHAPRNIAVVWKRFLAPVITQIRLNRMARRAARR